MPPKVYVSKAPDRDPAGGGGKQAHHTFTTAWCDPIDSLHTTRIAHVKRIYLLRHGKSDWGADYGSDHDRPLKNRGVRDARLMGHFLSATDQVPDAIVSSSAVRALTTARLAAEAGRWGCEARVEPAIYGATRDTVLEVIRGLDADLDSVLLAGHQPTFSDVTSSLLGAAQIRFPTAALACIDVPVARWDAVEFGRGMLVWFVTPKLLAGAGLGGA